MAEYLIRPVILCGGGGTRLWPLSTELRPKQFLHLFSGRTMLQETVARVADRTLFSKPLAIGSQRHEASLRTQLPGVELLLEPVGRNSGPAVAAAALLAKPDELLLVMPADHYISRPAAFLAAVKIAGASARAGRIVTFGVCPDYPATGYGYIEGAGGAGLQRALSFVEKPERSKACAFLETGRFYWNAGIFLFRAATIIDAFEAHAPDILAGVRVALTSSGLDRDAFNSVRSESIDYAVLEKAANIDVVPIDMGWSDLGDFAALHRLASKQSALGIVTEGPVASTDAKSIFVRTTGPRVALHGVENIAVVATREHVLVSGLDQAADIKAAVMEVQSAKCQLDAVMRARLGDWLFGSVLPRWAELSLDRVSGGFHENLGADGQPAAGAEIRGRVAPRQLYTYARAKALGWNPGGRADGVIEHALAFLDGPARSPRGGWAHKVALDGAVADERRDLYDHAFVALAGAELASLGDKRGADLAEEAFAVVDELFADDVHGGWTDRETVSGLKLANPHMHLLEASIAWYDAGGGSRALQRASTIAFLFERFMFDPGCGGVGELFSKNWSVPGNQRFEPGHCYEWAFLLQALERRSGRDTSSWQRRLVTFAEQEGLVNGWVIDQTASMEPHCRLWPQLERLRALLHVAPDGFSADEMVDRIFTVFLDHGAGWVWRDQITPRGDTLNDLAPASMLYHFMTAFAPLADKPA